MLSAWLSHFQRIVGIPCFLETYSQDYFCRVTRFELLNVLGAFKIKEGIESLTALTTLSTLTTLMTLTVTCTLTALFSVKSMKLDKKALFFFYKLAF